MAQPHLSTTLLRVRLYPEYRSEISQERKALRRKTVEAMETLGAGKSVTWIRRRIGVRHLNGEIVLRAIGT